MININYKTKSEEIITWIKKTVEGAKFQDVIIALSGGIDSAVAATLAVKALGKEHVQVLLLPYGALNDIATKDAEKIVTFLELPKENVHVVDIQKSVDEITQTVILNESEGSQSINRDSSALPQNDRITNIRKGNIMARVRMICLYDFAKKLNALVIGTENKSEWYLGYFTRFGDEASDIEPIRNLYKTQIWELGKLLGVPQEIIDKKPTAGLWEGQSDEGEFGFSYTDADRVLFHHFEEELPEEAIVNLGIDKDVVLKVLAWVAKQDFKHHLPYVFE